MLVRKSSITALIIVFILLTVMLLIPTVMAGGVEATPNWQYRAEGPINDVCISKNGEYVAIAANNVLYLIDDSGKLLWKKDVVSNTESIDAVSMSGELGGRIAAVSQANVYVLNAGGNQLYKYGANDPIGNVYISADSKYMAVGTGGFLHLVDAIKGKQEWSKETGAHVDGAAVSDDGEYVAAGTQYFVQVYDKNGSKLWEDKTRGNVKDMAISPEGDYVVSGGDGGVYFYDNREESRGQLSWAVSDYPVKSVSIASYGRYVAAASRDSLLLLDKGGRIKWEYETSGPVNGVAISPDGNYIAAGSNDNNLYFFSAILKGNIYVETYVNDTSTGNTTPVNASVYLDGRYKGETPKTISDIWAGTYTVNVSKTGYEEKSRDVKVEKDQTSKLLLELIPKPTATPTPTETSGGGSTATPTPTETGGGGLFGMPGFTAINMIAGAIIIASLLLLRKRG